MQQTLAKPGSGPRTANSARQRVQALEAGQYLKQVLKITYHARRKGARRLSWEIDHHALDYLGTGVFGKRLLMTDQYAWSTEDIILAYQGRSQAEAAFRQLQDVDHLTVRPQYHWTDQKVRVHTFICVLAFLLCRLLEHESRTAGYHISLSHLLVLLGTIRLALLVQPLASLPTLGPSQVPLCVYVCGGRKSLTNWSLRHGRSSFSETCARPEVTGEPGAAMSGPPGSAGAGRRRTPVMEQRAVLHPLGESNRARIQGADDRHGGVLRHRVWPVWAVGVSIQSAADRYRGIEILASGSHG